MPDFLGMDFLETTDGAVVKSLLHKAQAGLLIEDRVKSQIIRLMGKLLKANGLSRSVILLSILEKIDLQADIRKLSAGPHHYSVAHDTELGAMAKVYKHIAKYFQRKITLHEIAAVANLSHHSFCRFFKNHTGKTFVRFLLEARVAHACTLLSQKKQNLKTISQQSGFLNMTYFYKYSNR